MRKALITVQENQFSKDQIHALNDVVKGNYKKYVSDEKLMTIWCHVPTGQAYTNYQRSQSSIITIECKDEFAQQKRNQMLHACAQEWVSITGQHLDHVMLALVEEALFGELLQSNQQRLSSKGRGKMALHMTKAITRAAFTRRPISFNPNI